MGDATVYIAEYDGPESGVGRMVRMGVGRRDVEIREHASDSASMIGGIPAQNVIGMFDRGTGIQEEAGIGGIPADEVTVVDFTRTIVNPVGIACSRKEAFSGVGDEYRSINHTVTGQHGSDLVLQEDIVPPDKILHRAADSDPGVNGEVIRIPQAIVHVVIARFIPTPVRLDGVIGIELVENVKDTHATVSRVA